MKRIFLFLLAAALLTAPALAVPGDCCVVLGEELTLGEADSVYAALGTERGTVTELRLSAPDAAAVFSDVPDDAAHVGVYLGIREVGEGISLSLTNITGAEEAVLAALTAAGITDAELRAAASGETDALALLPAVFLAYETLTCMPLTPEAREAAAASLRQTLALEREIDASVFKELLDDMNAFFDELSALSDDALHERIRSIGLQHGITLNDAQIRQLADLFRKLQNLRLPERVENLPETVERIRENGESAVSAAETLWDRVRSFFERLGSSLSILFGE